MFCSNCGNEMSDDAIFCTVCGAKTGQNDTASTDSVKNTANEYVQKAGDFLKNTGVVALNDSEVSQYDVSDTSPELKKIFIEPDERLIGKFGNGYLVNLLYKKVKKCNALLTDKRVYLKGTFYSGTGKSIFKTTEERILDLEDVTGTGFIYSQMSKLMILWDLLCFIGALPMLYIVLSQIRYHYINPVFLLLALALITVGVISVMITLRSRKTFFFIDYAGGRIKVNARLVGLSDVRDFHKQMRRAKDALTGKK